MLRELSDPPASDRVETGLSLAGLMTAGFTAMCCLGVTAALSLSTSLGATFLTKDASLRPILIGTLALPVLASALSYWRHRGTIGPLVLSVAASVWIYALIFVVDSGQGPSHDTMGDHMGNSHAATSTAAHHGLSTGTQSLVWVGFAVLIGAQVWDFLRIRTRRRTATMVGEAV